MSIKSRDIARAIRNQFDDSTTLKTLTASTDSMYHDLAPEGADFPYIAFSIVSAVPDIALSELGTLGETVRVQFSIFDDSPSSSTIYPILDEVEAEYGANSSALTFDDTTYVNVASVRDNYTVGKSESGVWQITADYMLTLTKL